MYISCICLLLPIVEIGSLLQISLPQIFIYSCSPMFFTKLFFTIVQLVTASRRIVEFDTMTIKNKAQ